MKKLTAVLLLLLGCSTMSLANNGMYQSHLKIQAAKVKGFDFASGIDNPVWQKQPAHQFMYCISTVDDINRAPAESGTVQYLYDDRYLYVRAHFSDSDVMTGATKHGEHFYAQGDLLEVFIKHPKHNYYWEIYGTPNKLRTRFYYPSRAMLGLPSGFAPNDCPILVDAKVDGTFNDPRDVDKSWTVLLGIPRSELEKNGEKIAPGNNWLIFASRYNFSAHQNDRELSSFPQIPGSYHLYEYYAEIEFTE